MLMRNRVLGVLILMLAVGAASSYANDDQLVDELTERVADLEDRIAAYESEEQTAEDNSPDTGGGTKAVNAGGDEMHLYGKVRVSVDQRSGDFVNTGTSIASNASRIGINGSSALDFETTRVIYKVEMQYEATDSVDGNQSKELEFREGFVGLKGDWGTMRAGRLSVAYKMTLGMVDPWIDSALESHAGGRQGSSELHGNFFNNTIEQQNQLWGDKLSTSVWYASQYSGSAKPLHNTGTLRNYTGGSASGIGVHYREGPLFLGADIIRLESDAVTLGGLTNGDGWQVAARYEVGDISVGVFYEDVDDLGLGKNTYANVIYTLGNTRFIASVSENNDAVVYGNNKFRNLNVGVKSSIGDNTEVVAAFNRNSDTTNNLDFDTFTIGLNTNFGN